MDRPRAPRTPKAQDAARTPIRDKAGEMKVYGVNACRALWQERAADIIRVYVGQEMLRDFRPLLKWCAEKKKAYHVLADADLERVAASVHHEGVVILAKEPRRLDDLGLLSRLAALPEVCPLLFLDGVGNPHNVGSMLRVATHFGAPLALGEVGGLPRLTPSAARMAEGGMEHVTLVDLHDPKSSIKACHASGFELIAATGDGEEDLYRTTLPKRAIFAVGNELTGLSPALRRNAHRSVRIPGTGRVESLNVAMATALLLGEFWRQHKSRP